MRLFFAVEVPDVVKAKILDAQQRIAITVSPKGFRLTKPDMMHVTLAFVGEVSEENLDEIKERAAMLCESTPSTKLCFESLGCFPAWKHPRILWIGVIENGFMPYSQEAPLASLGRKLWNACEEFSDHKPEDNVLLHVTLARSGDRLSKEDMRTVGELAAADFWSAFGETEARSVVLYESTLGKSGPVQHNPLARFPLKS